MTNLFAWRYFKSPKSTNAINIIAWISMIAITIVTAALLVVLSVFNGFEGMVNSLYGDFYADIAITPAQGKYFRLDEAMREKMTAVLPADSRLMPVVQERAVLVDEEDKSIVWLKGVPADYDEVAGVADAVYRGRYAIGTRDEPALVVGSGVENALQIRTGMAVFPLTVYLPNKNASSTDPLDALFSANAFPVGTFSIQQDFDDQYAFTNVSFMQYMMGLDSLSFTSLEWYGGTQALAEKDAKRLQQQLGPDFVVKTRVRQNQNLYAAMATERLIIYAVAVLILLIAAFNIISSLTMMVLEKRSDIALLQAVGATGTTIGSIYLRLGIILAGIGGLAGLIIGTLICLGQQQFHWVKISGQSFLIDHYPVDMKWQDFLLIIGILAVVAFVAGFVPSRRAARMHYTLRSAE